MLMGLGDCLTWIAFWLSEESMLRGDNFEYDAEEANKVLHQEKMDEQWMLMGNNDSDCESGDECT